MPELPSMNRRNFIKYSCAVGASMYAQRALAGTPIATSGGRLPNLVIVFPDQMRGQALGFMGEDPVLTPHLDQFAKQSVVLPKAVSSYPVCSPFRASLMTGQFGPTNGVNNNVTSKSAEWGCQLKAEARCWSDVLHDRGYSLGYIGKWHLDSPHAPYVDCANNKGPLKWNEWCPPARRHHFDYWYAYGTYDMHMRPMYWSTDAKRDEFHYVDQWGPEHEADKAIQYIRNQGGQYRKADQPFALVVSMNPPHTPYKQHPEKYMEPYADKPAEKLLVRPNVDKTGKTKMGQHALKCIKDYFACVTGVDEQFGRIVKAIDDAGLGEGTIILFTSDHGDCVGTHNHETKNNPYEESMRVPFMVRWTGRIKPRHDPLLIGSTDIHPTLLGLMGLAGHIPASVQGTDYSGLLLGGNGPRPTSQFYLRGDDLRGVRTDRYKLILRKPDSKAGDGRLLFDLKEYPYEMNNLIDTRPDLVKQLIEEELKPWLVKTNDPWIKTLV